MKKVGLLGGSFDPIHIGHMSIVQEAIKQFDLDEFYFIPTGMNPWIVLMLAMKNVLIC